MSKRKEGVAFRKPLPRDELELESRILKRVRMNMRRSTAFARSTLLLPYCPQVVGLREHHLGAVKVRRIEGGYRREYYMPLSHGLILHIGEPF